MALASKYQSIGSKVKQQAASRKFVGGGTKFNLPEGVSFFTPKKGTTHMNIVPYEVTVDKHPAGVPKGQIWYERKYQVHFSIGADEKSYVCPKSIGKRCPICEYRARLAKSNNPDEDALKTLKPKERVLYNVYIVGDEEAGVQLWDFSYYLFTKKLEDEINEGDEENTDFAMPDTSGKVLAVRFGEKTMGANTNPFLETTRIDFKDRDESLSDDVLESAVDLDTILKVLPFEELEAIFLEMDDSEEKEVAEEKKEKSKQEKKTPAREEKSKQEKKEVEKEVEKEKEEEQPQIQPKSKQPSSSDEECPNGGVFGVDTDNLDSCDSCPLWDKCITKKEG